MSNSEVHGSPKKRLGRGLDSLLGSTEAALGIDSSMSAASKNVLVRGEISKKSRLFILGIDQLKPNPKQPRKHFEKTDLESLAASVKEKGIVQPIVIREMGPSDFQIVAGERRWRAAQMAGLSEVPVIVRESNDQETLEVALIENIQRAQLNPLEEAEAYQRLSKEFFLTQQEIAEKVSKDRATVANTMRLLDLPMPVRELLVSGQLTAGHAKAILGLTDAAQQETLAETVVRRQLSVRATEALVGMMLKDLSLRNVAEPLNIDISSKLVERLREDLQKSLGTKVQIDYKNNKGRVAIYFYSDDELSKLIERLKTTR